MLLGRNQSHPLLNATPSHFSLPLTKKKISITIDDDLLKWLDSKIKTKKFANRSHGLEYALSQLKEKS